MTPDQILRWYADWTASADAYRTAAITGMNEVLTSLGLEPIEVAS